MDFMTIFGWKHATGTTIYDIRFGTTDFSSSIYLSIYLTIYLSIYLANYLSNYRAIYLAICLSIYPST